LRYIILGFPNCGSTSLEQDLINKGHDVIRDELSYIYPVEHIRNIIGDRKVILITKEGFNRQNVNYREHLPKYAEFNPEIVKLEDLKKVSGFPWKNQFKKGTTTNFED
jgi:hypothetical protein